MGVNGVEFGGKPLRGGVDHQLDRAQGMPLRNEVLRGDLAENGLSLLVLASQNFLPSFQWIARENVA
jgi:hypothetical protein